MKIRNFETEKPHQYDCICHPGDDKLGESKAYYVVDTNENYIVVQKIDTREYSIWNSDYILLSCIIGEFSGRFKSKTEGLK